MTGNLDSHELFLLLVDAAARGTILLAAACMTTRLLQGSSAAVRHRVWASALCGLIALPVVSRVAPVWPLPVLPAFSAKDAPLSARVARQPGLVASNPPHEARAEGDEPARLESTSSRDMSVAPKVPVRSAMPRPVLLTTSASASSWTWTPAGIGLAVWGGGFLALMAPTLAGLLVNENRRLRADRIVSDEWTTLVRELGRRLSIRRPVDLRRNGEDLIPMTWGVLRPVILLPESSQSWPEPRRRAVLLHELAHVERLDALSQIAGRLAAALYWFHPLAWYALHRMRIECEHACDDRVVDAGERAEDYAEQLLDLARTLRVPHWSIAEAMSRRNILEDRLIALFDDGRSHRPLNLKASRRLLGLSCAAVLGLTLFQPQPRAIAGPGPIPILAPAQAQAPAPKSSPPLAVDNPAAEALRAASEAASGLESKASSGSPDVRVALLGHLYRLQEEAGLRVDAAATAGHMADVSKAYYYSVTWATSQARAGDIGKATAIANTLQGEHRDQIMAVVATETARTDLNAARALAADLGERADAPAAWAGIGSTRASAGDADDASEAFAEAIRIAKLIPDSHPHGGGRMISRMNTLKDIANRQVKAGRLDQALATSTLIKDIPPIFQNRPADMARASAGFRAGLLRAAGRIDEACRALEGVTDPPADAVLALAEACGRAGQPDRAARWLAEARRQVDAMPSQANRTWSLAALAEAQTRVGRPGEARATFDEAQANALKQPDDFLEPGLSLKAVIKARVATGDLDGAERGVMILGDRQRAVFLGQVAAAWSGIGDRATAEALLATIGDVASRERAAKPEPDAPARASGPESETADRAIALAGEGKVDEAMAAALKINWVDTKLRALDSIAKTAPASADRIYLQMVGLADPFDARSSGRPSIAAALADSGHPDLALQVMEQVKEIPVGEWALVKIGKAQARVGNFAGARVTIASRLKTRAGRAPVLCDLACALKDAGRRDEAVAALREAEAVIGGMEPDLAAIATLAVGFHKAGRLEEARRWADRASDAVDTTVYAYVGGSYLGTVMYGREQRLEEAATIYADLGLPAKIWPFASRCDPVEHGIEACLRQASRASAVSDSASVTAHLNDPAVRATSRAAILLGFAEGLLASGGK